MKNRTFFFFSYEGLRLRRPNIAITDVPGAELRQIAAPNVLPFLSAFPIASGAQRSNGLAEFAASFADPGRHDVGSIRIDDAITQKLNLFVRYNAGTSRADSRGAGLFSLNTIGHSAETTQTLTARLSITASPTVVAEISGNYSRVRERNSYSLDRFGGARIDPNWFASGLQSDGRSITFDLNGMNAGLANLAEVISLQQQTNIVGALTVVKGQHEFKFGADFRRLAPIAGFRRNETNLVFYNPINATMGDASQAIELSRNGLGRPVFTQFSAYGQDNWKATQRLNVSFGLRWDLDQAPSTSNGTTGIALTNSGSPQTLAASPEGGRLWRTKLSNFAPRLGLTYEINGSSGRELVLRTSAGLVFNGDSSIAAEAFSNSIPFVSARVGFNVPIPQGTSEALSGLTAIANAPLVSFDPALRPPYALQWSGYLQQALGTKQSISVGYVGIASRRQYLTQTLIDQNAHFPFLRLTGNGGQSDYHAFQAQFERRVASGFGALVGYTWSRSMDNMTADSVAHALLFSGTKADRGPSDFDARHVLSGVVSYNIPPTSSKGIGNRLLSNWTAQTMINVRSATPINIVYGVPTLFGYAYIRPDLNEGVALRIFDNTVAGGYRINPDAFSVPTLERQGTLGRNSLRGFAFYQFDFALRRKFVLTEGYSLSIEGNVFNVMNHPNFENPAGINTSLGTFSSGRASFVSNPSFGQSMSLLGRGLLGGSMRGFNSANGPGGPRSIQLAVKFEF